MGKVLMCVLEGGSSPRKRECNLFHLGTQRISFLLILAIYVRKNHPNCILAIIYTRRWGETIMQQCHVTWCTALPILEAYISQMHSTHIFHRENF